MCICIRTIYRWIERWRDRERERNRERGEEAEEKGEGTDIEADEEAGFENPQSPMIPRDAGVCEKHSFCVSLGPATQQQKLQSSPRLSALKADCPTCLLIWRSGFSDTDTERRPTNIPWNPSILHNSSWSPTIPSMSNMPRKKCPDSTWPNTHPAHRRSQHAKVWGGWVMVFLWVSCFLTCSSIISPEFRQNHHNFCQNIELEHLKKGITTTQPSQMRRDAKKYATRGRDARRQTREFQR